MICFANIRPSAENGLYSPVTAWTLRVLLFFPQSNTLLPSKPSPPNLNSDQHHSPYIPHNNALLPSEQYIPSFPQSNTLLRSDQHPPSLRSTPSFAQTNALHPSDQCPPSQCLPSLRAIYI